MLGLYQEEWEQRAGPVRHSLCSNHRGLPSRRRSSRGLKERRRAVAGIPGRESSW